MRSNRNHRHGLTLIELAFVVAILAILAGFLVPRLGTVRNLAARAGNADQARAALDQAVLYNVTQGHYPGGLDTLTDGTALLPAVSSAGNPVHLDPALAAELKLAGSLVDKNVLKSINTQLTVDSSGNTGVILFNHNLAAAVSGDSGTVQTTLPTTGTTATIAYVDWTTTGGAAVYQGVYGSARLNSTTNKPNDGTFLVAFGFGPSSELNGRTALGAPALYTKDPTSYNRPVLLLKVYPTGSQLLDGSTGDGTAAATAGALSPDGNIVSTSLSKYNQEKQR